MCQMFIEVINEKTRAKQRIWEAGSKDLITFIKTVDKIAQRVALDPKEYSFLKRTIVKDHPTIAIFNLALVQFEYISDKSIKRGIATARELYRVGCVYATDVHPNLSSHLGLPSSLEYVIQSRTPDSL